MQLTSLRRAPIAFESLILYIDSRDASVMIEEIRPEPAPDPTLAIMTGAFDGFIADGDYFEFPSTAAVYAGVANTNMSMYPLSFPQVAISSLESVVLSFRG